MMFLDLRINIFYLRLLKTPGVATDQYISILSLFPAQTTPHMVCKMFVLDRWFGLMTNDCVYFFLFATTENILEVKGIPIIWDLQQVARGGAAASGIQLDSYILLAANQIAR